MLALAALEICASDGNLTFSYDNANADQNYWGTKKRERYDVAIVVEQGMLDGTLLQSVEIPVNGAEKMTDVSIWIASELSEYGGFKAVYSYTVDMSTDYDSESGTLRHTFTEPYRITEGKPMYVGYSFSLSALNSESSQPLVVVPGKTGQTFVHANSLNKLNKWTDLGRSHGYSSCMRVQIADAKTYAACFTPINTLRMQSGTENIILTSVVNHGAAEIESIGYEGKIGQEHFSGNINLDSPIPNVFGAVREVNIQLPPIAENGKYNLELKVATINGNANEESTAVSAEANLYSFIPVKRPLMEEYTASSCGYCPKGMAALELMKNRNGDDFVGVSFHTWGDPLDFFTDLPIMSNGASFGLPTSQLDRVSTIDPYLGTNKSGFGLDKCWDERASQFTTAAIGLNGYVNGSDVTLTANVEFLNAIEEGTYRVEFFVAADGLTNPNWSQKNYFSKNEDSRILPGLEKFVDSPGTIRGIVYDDVVVAWSGLDGGESLPKAKPYESLETTKILTIPEVASTGRLRGVAAVVDCATGEVLNSIQYRLDGSGVDAPMTDSQIVETSYLSLQGVRMINPEGLCIRQDKFADGSCRYIKMYIKK